VSFDQKILVIRFSSIGDIVLATSPLKTIRRAYPDAQITFLTLDTFAPLLEYHPDIDALVSISKRMSLIELWGFADHIRRKQYRNIFDLHNSIRSNLVTLRSSSPVYQLKKPRWNRFLLFYFHHNEFGSDFSTLKMYHEHLGSIWNENDDLPATLLKVSNYEQKMARDMLLDKNIFDEFIAVVPGAAWTQKQWPAEKYIETLNQLGFPQTMSSPNANRRASLTVFRELIIAFKNVGQNVVEFSRIFLGTVLKKLLSHNGSAIMGCRLQTNGR